MNNKATLLHLVDRAERGALLAGEAQILRDAIELLDDLAMTLDSIAKGYRTVQLYQGYEASDTQSFTAIDTRRGEQ